MASKRKRRTTRPVLAAKNEPPSIEQRDQAVRRLALDFMRALPPGALGGNYVQTEGDKFGADLPVPDGLYRVGGTDWVFSFEGGVFAEAFVASKQNDYGGPDVIAIASS